MQTQEKQVNERRNFLKKAAYVAPAIVALGTLTEVSAKKDTSKIKKPKK